MLLFSVGVLADWEGLGAAAAGCESCDRCELVTDPGGAFSLRIAVCLSVCLSCSPADSEAKWSQLGELALANGQLEVAQQCFVRAKDLGGLLLLHSSHANAAGMAELAGMAGAGPGRGSRGGSSKAGRRWQQFAWLWLQATCRCLQAAPHILRLFARLTCSACPLPIPSFLPPCRGCGAPEHRLHLPLPAGPPGCLR